MPTSIPNFNFLARLISEIWGGPKIKSGSSWFPQTSPSGQFFLYRELVRVNAYKCAKFQLPSSISYGDMEGGPKIKRGRCWSPQTPPSDKFLYVAIVPANAYQHTKFQLFSSISFGDMRGFQIKKSGSSWFSQTPPSVQIFIRGVNTRKCLQVCQISSS